MDATHQDSTGGSCFETSMGVAQQKIHLLFLKLLLGMFGMMRELLSSQVSYPNCKCHTSLISRSEKMAIKSRPENDLLEAKLGQ